MDCKICGQPATGSEGNWQCSADKYHYWQHRANQIRAAKQEWKRRSLRTRATFSPPSEATALARTS